MPIISKLLRKKDKVNWIKPLKNNQIKYNKKISKLKKVKKRLKRREKMSKKAKRIKMHNKTTKRIIMKRKRIKSPIPNLKKKLKRSNLGRRIRE